MYNTQATDKLAALKRGQAVMFEGIEIRPTGAVLAPGTTYFAARNTEQFLTVKRVDETNGWVYPVEDAYVFDTWECVPVAMTEEHS